MTSSSRAKFFMLVVHISGVAVGIAAGLPPAAQVLLTDPQTSGGLLAACAPEAVDDVLAVFRAAGFGRAAVIGEIVAGEPRVEVR